MRRFNLVRDQDVSGVSGTGIIAQGVEFDGGKVAFTWLSHYSAVTIFDSISALERVHGHEGKTKVEWLDQKD